MNKGTICGILVQQVFLLLMMSARLAGAGAEIEVPRVLSLSAAATHVLTALGNPPLAIDQYGLIAAGDNPPEVVGRGSMISIEKITELQINRVVLWYYQSDAERLFRDRGIKVMTIPPLRLHTYPELLTRLGELANKKDKAKELRAKFETELKAAREWQNNKKPVRVYFELYSEWKAVGKQSFPGDLLEAAGGLCPTDKTGLISPEKILEFSPEVIFFVQGTIDPQEMLRRPGLASSPAARDKRIHAVDRRLITEGLAILEAIEFFRHKLTQTR